MSVRDKIVNDVLLLELSGDMDLNIADKLKERADKLLNENSCKHLVINLKDVEFIDSSGLGMILGRYKFVSEKGGRVLLVGPQPQVRRILEMSGLEKIMGIYESETEAFAEMV